jgi:hypothetical protein
VIGKPETIFEAVAQVNRFASQHMICEFRIGQQAPADARKVHMIIVDQKPDLFFRPDLAHCDHRDAL